MADESIDAIPTHVTQVLRTERLSEHYLRLTVGGGGLERYRSIAPDEFVYVLLPPPGRTELTIDEGFTWTAAFAMADADRPVGAYYSVRSFRPEVGEMDLDVYLHDPPGHVSGWAPRAQPGDPVALWGPRTAYDPPGSVDWWLLVADETGRPATARILEELPADAIVRVLVEIPDAGEARDLAARPGTEITWLPRDGRPSAGSPQLLDAVRALTWPAGEPYVWGGGESRAMTAVRKHVRREVGLARERVSLTAYWRHPAHADDEPDDDQDD